MLGELSPEARPAFEEFLKTLDAAIGETQYIVFEGRRSAEVQEAYYAQGRLPLEVVNKMRKLAGLYLLRSEKDNYPITWMLKSRHIEGMAMDVLPVDARGQPSWDLAHYRAVFEAIRDCGREAGLVCGADWPAPQTDWPHYEVKAG
jgi:peptidoglycan L-alanyl-D-glutamate endopeptidase CwlK